MDNKSVFELINENSLSQMILTCEHASADVPEEYCDLGLVKAELNRHIARDKGCREITKLLAGKLGCWAILGKYSRLLIDLNRKENEEELIVTQSDGTLIPGNQNLEDNERQKRIEIYYRPYYEAIEMQINNIRSNGKEPIIFSIHSYTPQLKGGAYRPWQAGVLFRKQTNFAGYLYRSLLKTGKIVGENVPYDLRKYNTGAAVVCGEQKGLDYALIEIRDDAFDNMEKGTREWSCLLADILGNYKSC